MFLAVDGRYPRQADPRLRSVNNEVVWKTVREDLPALIPMITRILEETRQCTQAETAD
jgi:hypothetical protein